MKDHRKAEVVNEITALAKRYAGTQQLRDHMSGAILAYLFEQDRDTRRACAEAMSDCEMMDDKWIHVDSAHDTCMKTKAV